MHGIIPAGDMDGCSWAWSFHGILPLMACIEYKFQGQPDGTYWYHQAILAPGAARPYTRALVIDCQGARALQFYGTVIYVVLLKRLGR